MKPLRGAIFDLDGTLLDSMSVWTQVDRDFLAVRGLPYTQDYTDVLKHLDFRASAEYTVKRYHLSDSPAEVMDEWLRMVRQAYAETVLPKPDTVALVRGLAAKGVRLAVATALSPTLFEPCLERLGLKALFSAFAHCDEIPCAKNEPDVYLLAATRLGLAPAECIVLEDILPGIRSAAAAGFRTVAVYDASSAADFPQMCAESSDRFEDLLHDYTNG